MLRSFPFTADSYLSLFEAYNSTIWPAQVGAYALGILALFLVLRPVAAGGRIVFAVLSVFWLWNGIAYHLMHFFQINFAALGFAALFVLQGVLFAAIAIGGRRSFRFRPDVLGWTGLILCLFALVAYPAEYGNSGIMTFIVGKDGTVYQKDLGEKTTDLGTAMAQYNPGDGWSNAFGKQAFN